MTKVDIKELDNSQVEITGSIPAEKFDQHRSEAIQNLGKDIELQGFRKGHVPADVLEKHLGEQTILQEMAEITIGREYKNIVLENKLDPISRPDVGINKMAMGNPLEFTITVTVMPSVTLGDYKKAAQKVFSKDISVEVEDKEVEDTIEEIRKMYAAQSPQNTTTEEDQKKDEAQELPELNDEFVKTLGDFENVDAFKVKLKENIANEKEQKEKEKQRADLFDEITNNTEIKLPQMIIEAEQQKMLAQFKADIEQAGLTYEDYLKKLEKNEEELLKEFEKEAEKRAKLQLALNQIAKEENITVDHAEVEKQVESLMQQYPQANRENVHVYVESNMVNQKVIEFLENQKK